MAVGHQFGTPVFQAVLQLLWAACRLAYRAVIDRGPISTCLQGGICAVLDAADSVEAHVQDTMVAGAFLNDRK